MAYKNKILFGRITKAHGYEGIVVIRLEQAFVENIPEMETIFIETEGRPVPFFISESEYSGGDVLKMKFEGYHAIEKVNEFVGCKVFLTKMAGTEKSVQNFEALKGFKVLLIDQQLLGTITDIIQNPGQELLSILTPGNREILVPLHEDFIIKADKRLKTIIMDLPEGLINLNSAPNLSQGPPGIE